MDKKTTIEDLKERTDTHAERIAGGIENLILLQKESNGLLEESNRTNKAILKVKVVHHDDWMYATNKRFYVAVVSIIATGAVLYLDVLKLDEESALVAVGLGVFNALAGG
tara:strand:+ start:579 stop:908 length:330 start_codon:yes stop_codon:yes gene_type:complete